MALLAARIGVTLNYNPPYSPEGKAKIERFWGSLKSGWMASLDMRDFHSLEEVRQSFYDHIVKYNHRPHSSLEGISPQERFFQESSRIKRISEESMDKAFLLEEERRVSADGGVVLDNTAYEVDCRYAKKKICLRYSPDHAQIYIVEGGGMLTPVRLLNKHENAKVKRKKVYLSGDEGNM